MFNLDVNYKSVLAVGLVGLVGYYLIKSDAVAVVSAVADNVGEAVDYIASGQAGGSLYDSTHDADGTANWFGDVLDRALMVGEYE